MTTETSQPFEELAPWQQVAALHHKKTEQRDAAVVAPRMQLRGDRVYLRALRAAEMTAWGDTTFFAVDRSIIRRHLTQGERPAAL